MCWHAHLKCVCEFKKKKEKENTHTKKKRAYCNESDREVLERRTLWRKGADKKEIKKDSR